MMKPKRTPRKTPKTKRIEEMILELQDMNIEFILVAVTGRRGGLVDFKMSSENFLATLVMLAELGGMLQGFFEMDAGADEAMVVH